MSFSAQEKRIKLRALMVAEETLICPGIYDAYGARLIQQAGFNAAYMTGNGVSASLLGVPDIGQVDLTMIASHARRIASCIDIPLICDADTGYGGVLNIKRTIEEFEAAGVAAIHIEDQVFPKRCAQFPGARDVLEFDEAVNHIKAAVNARQSSNMVIIARTDSAGQLGLAEAIRSAKAFIAEGADAVFVEVKTNTNILHDIQQIKNAVGAPCLVNLDIGGEMSNVLKKTLKQIGVDIGIHPSLARGIFGFAMHSALLHLKQNENLGSYAANMWSSQEYNRALGLDRVEAWEAKFSSDN